MRACARNIQGKHLVRNLDKELGGGGEEKAPRWETVLRIGGQIPGNRIWGVKVTHGRQELHTQAFSRSDQLGSLSPKRNSNYAGAPPTLPHPLGLEVRQNSIGSP